MGEWWGRLGGGQKVMESGELGIPGFSYSIIPFKFAWKYFTN